MESPLIRILPEIGKNDEGRSGRINEYLEDDFNEGEEE